MVTDVALAEFQPTAAGSFALVVALWFGLKQSTLQAGRVDVDMLLLFSVVTYCAYGQRLHDSKMTQVSRASGCKTLASNTLHLRVTFRSLWSKINGTPTGGQNYFFNSPN